MEENKKNSGLKSGHFLLELKSKYNFLTTLIANGAEPLYITMVNPTYGYSPTRLKIII